MNGLMLGSAVLAALALPPACATTDFDYVIVGAGTAGNVVANRLSRDPNISVAVIDPGADQRSNPNVTNPMIWLNNLGTSTDWAYQTVPQANASNRVITFDAGKGIGGTSLINGKSGQSRCVLSFCGMFIDMKGRHDIYSRGQGSI